MSRTSIFGFSVWVSLLPALVYGQMNDVRPTQMVLLSGRLKNPDGISISNATVVLNSTTPGTNESAMRTTGNGRFAFSVAPNRSYKLHFSAPGFSTLTLPVSVAAGTRILELPDTVLTVGSTSETLASTKQALSRATLSADLLEQIKNDLNFEGIQECLKAKGESFEQVLRTTWLRLRTDHDDELLVQGLGTCLGGANNGPMLVYAQFGGKWRRVFEGIGDRLDTLPNRTHGFLDLARWQHGSAFMSAEIVYRFNGHEYKAIRCTDVEFVDWETNKPYPTPRRSPCENWKASEP